MNNKETAKWIRTCLKRHGIAASVRMSPSDANGIQVSTKAYGSFFTSEEIETICFVAKVNELTLVRGMEIDPAAQSALTGKQQFNFYA